MIKLKDNKAWIEPQTAQGFVQSLAGVFKLTPKEVKIFAIILYLIQDKQDHTISTDIKEEIATITGHSLQVITNYITKFRRKKAIVDDKPHFAFMQEQIIISYER